jgi:hypothetical protein
MPVPWLRLIDAALGLSDVVRRTRGRNADTELRQLTAPQSASMLGGIEARLAGVVVSALREAFDRDSRRLDLEREQMEAERQKAERLLRLELLRQAGEREIARLRLVAVAATAGWVAALILSVWLPAAGAARVLLGFGWVLLLIALLCSFLEQARLSRALAVADERLSVETSTAPAAAGLAAPWLVGVGLVAVSIGVLIR